MASVVFDGVRKVYATGQVAVRGASFQVADSELVVLVGPSGCGKSTLLRMVAGLESISAGTLTIGGRIVNDVPPKDRDVAMVFQSYALYPHMTVADNLAFGLRLRGVPIDVVRRRVRESAALLGLDELLDRRPRHLSGGQRQRVALGRALVRQPKVFLLDEPLSNLDAKLRLSMRAEIARLHRRLNTTMLYVTHDQIEAMTLGQRIVVLDAGEIQQIDTPMRLYERPANVFVATFLGSPEMNLFRGRLVLDRRPRLVVAGAELTLGDLPSGLRGGPATGTDLVVGLRPEHLQLAGDGAAGDRISECRIHVQIETVEPVGNEVFVTAKHGAGHVTARIPPQQLPQPGEHQLLAYSTASLHYFRADDGRRI